MITSSRIENVAKGTVGLSREIQIWSKKPFQGVLDSPENASRDQAMPRYRQKIHLKTINGNKRQWKFLLKIQDSFREDVQ